MQTTHLENIRIYLVKDWFILRVIPVFYYHIAEIGEAKIKAESKFVSVILKFSQSFKVAYAATIEVEGISDTRY